MKLALQQFRQAYKDLSAVPMVPGIVSSEFVKLSAAGGVLTMRLTGNVTGCFGVSSTVPDRQEWVFYADRQLLSKFLSSASHKKLEINFAEEKTNTSLVLRSGRSRLKLPGRDGCSGYTSWRKDKKDPGTVLNKGDIKVVSMLSEYCARNPGSRNQAICAYGSYYLASDTGDTCIAAVRMSPMKREEPVYIPGLLTGLKSAPTGISVHKAGVGLTFGYGYLHQSLPEEVSKFPYQRVVEVVEGAVKAKGNFEVSGDTLLKSIKAMLAYGIEEVSIELSEGTAQMSVSKEILEAQRKLPIKLIKPSKKWRMWLRPISTWLAFVVSNSPKTSVTVGHGSSGESYFTSRILLDDKAATAALIAVDLED